MEGSLPSSGSHRLGSSRAASVNACRAPLGSNMQLEVVPYIGWGRAYIRSDDFPRQPGQSQNGEDATWEAGINASFLYTFDSGFQLGANARYFYTRSHVSDKAGGFEYDMEIQDFALGAMIGVRL